MVRRLTCRVLRVHRRRRYLPRQPEGGAAARQASEATSTCTKWFSSDDGRPNRRHVESGVCLFRRHGAATINRARQHEPLLNSQPFSRSTGCSWSILAPGTGFVQPKYRGDLYRAAFSRSTIPLYSNSNGDHSPSKGSMICLQDSQDFELRSHETIPQIIVFRANNHHQPSQSESLTKTMVLHERCYVDL